MYFKPFLIEKMVRNQKHKTRRIIKPGETALVDIHDMDTIVCVLNTNGRKKWEVGGDVAICPGRGKPVVWVNGTNIIYEECQYTPATVLAMAFGGFAPYRRKIVAIQRERACDISEEDAKAEGFEGRREFLDAWDKINGKRKREAQVWVLTFEVAA